MSEVHSVRPLLCCWTSTRTLELSHRRLHSASCNLAASLATICTPRTRAARSLLSKGRDMVEFITYVEMPRKSIQRNSMLLHNTGEKISLSVCLLFFVLMHSCKQRLREWHALFQALPGGGWGVYKAKGDFLFYFLCAY